MTDHYISQILKLLHGDKVALKRLVYGAIARYPGHRAEWYLQKVLWDLQRDRTG
jgi:hypothetical protein